MNDFLLGLTTEQIDHVALVIAAERIGGDTVRSALDQLRLVVMAADYDRLEREREIIALAIERAIRLRESEARMALVRRISAERRGRRATA